MARKIKKEDVPFFWIKSGSESKNESIHSIHTKIPQENPAIRDTKRMYTTTNAATAGLKNGWTRATFIVREENLKKLKALAYWDRKGIKDIVDEALQAYLKTINIPSEPPQI